jgi:hypothetical protein
MMIIQSFLTFPLRVKMIRVRMITPSKRVIRSSKSLYYKVVLELLSSRISGVLRRLSTGL